MKRYFKLMRLDTIEFGQTIAIDGVDAIQIDKINEDMDSSIGMSECVWQA
jgi:hypothetical protein